MAGCAGADDRAPDALAQRIAGEVAELAALLRPGAATAISPGTAFEADLGFDSLTMAELVDRVEAVTGRRLPATSLAEVVTVADLVAAASVPGSAVTLHAERAGQPRPPASPSVRRPEAQPTEPPAFTFRGAAARLAFGVAATVGGVLVAVLPGRLRRWEVVRRAGRWLFAVVGARLDVRGAAHLPSDRRYVVVANHPSFLDPLAVAMTLPAGATFTATEGLRDLRVARFLLGRLGVELVPASGDRRRGVVATGVLTRLVEQGRTLVFFPEGRRSTSIGLERFRLGAFVVAARAGVPVVPVAVRGTRAILPVGARWPRPGDIEVEIGPPLRATGAGFAAAAELHHRARGWLLDACDEPDVGHLARD